jgi:hypothetical protein
MRLERLLLAVGLAMTGHAVATPIQVVFAIPGSKSRLGLLMAGNHRGQFQVKRRAAPRRTHRPQAPTMRLNNRPADAKPHAGAVGLSRKEWLEYLLGQLWRKPYTGIGE